MRAKRRGTYVYTEPGGHGAGIETVSTTVTVGDACPHGGFRIGKVLVCGECGDSEHQLGLAILYIAKKVAYQVTGKTFTANDVIGGVSLALVLNRDRILKANNPGALAYVIGRRAALRLYRSGRSVPTVAVSQMNLPENDNDGESLETTTQRLEYLYGTNVVQRELEEEWREVCSGRGRTFPGLDLVMNQANLLLLRRVIEEARQRITLDTWHVIELRLDLDDFGECLTWREISKLTPYKMNDLPEIYRQGLAVIHDHIVKRLMTKPLT
jgi:hypothetical protein